MDSWSDYTNCFANFELCRKHNNINYNNTNKVNNNNNNVLFQTNVHIQFKNIKNTYINKNSTKNNITINTILIYLHYCRIGEWIKTIGDKQVLIILLELWSMRSLKLYIHFRSYSKKDGIAS